ncbi:MAG: hypothetical protein ACREDJ_01260 [Methylocella sp.]
MKQGIRPYSRSIGLRCGQIGRDEMVRASIIRVWPAAVNLNVPAPAVLQGRALLLARRVERGKAAVR